MQKEGKFLAAHSCTPNAKVEQMAKEKAYPLDFDTRKLAQIIEKAKTPQEAAEMIKTEMKLEPIIFGNPAELSELQLFSSSRQLVGSYVPSAKSLDDKTVAFVNGEGPKNEGQYFAEINEYFNSMFLE